MTEYSEYSHLVYYNHFGSWEGTHSMKPGFPSKPS
jgi:hypothetical protein